jgi:Carboxypeptidase regulatory-like domain
MKIRFLARVTFACIAVFLLLAVSAHAQFRTSIQGTVTDPDGAVVPGATLSLKDNGTNHVITATSDSGGVFNFNALPADQFTLTASAKGFQQKVIENLQVIPEQANSVNVQLALGEASTTVTVSGDTAAAMDTETANIGGTVSANDIQHYPSPNRDVFTLTQLVPGAISDGGQNAGGGVRSNPGTQGPGGSGSGGAFPTENGPQANANGGQYETNGISIDGISTVSAVWGGTTIITPNEDSIDNVRIVTNDYDAENGRFSGAETMVTSKSGTNQFHGSAFFAIHRPGLNAYNRHPLSAINGSPINKVRDTARFNQYGGSIGGPIIKNRLFAFFSYETSPNSSTSNGFGWYETQAFQKSAPANSIASQYLNFPGGTPVGTYDAAGTCSLAGLVEGTNCKTIAGQGIDIGSPLKIGLGKQDPTATATNANPGVGNGLDGVADVAYYATTTPSTSYYHDYNGRMDANATSKDHLAFTIYWVPQGSSFYNGGARAYNLFYHNQINEALAVIWNHTFSPTWLNEARANAAGWRWNEVADNPQAPVGLPTDNISYFGSGGNINQFGSNLGSDLNQWTYTYKDLVTKVEGNHTIKFGAEFTQLHYLNYPIYSYRPSFNFYNIWNFLNDAPYFEQGTFNSVTGAVGGPRSDDREKLFGAFVQDSWRATPTLTVNAGIRYSYFGSLYAKQNNLSSVRFGGGTAAYTGLTVATNRSLWNPQKLNFGPQLGFNWSPSFSNGKMVVRGGFGLNFNQEEIAITANAGNNPPTANGRSWAWTNPTTPGPNAANINYALSSNPGSLLGFPPNPNAITTYNSAGLPTGGSANIIIIGDGNGNLPTTYMEHFSLGTDYQLNRELIASVGYQGSLGRHIISHQTPNAPAVVAGYPLNQLVTGGDFWINGGSSNNNAMLLELKHPMVHHFSGDAQFMWAKSLDTNGSGPYYEDPYYPLGSGYSYGPSDFNIGKSFKLFALWQPVIFHGSNGWMEKILGEWSLSGIFNLHTGFPYSPTYGTGTSMYCNTCGYSNIRPFYLGGGGSNHGNSAFYNATNFTGIPGSGGASTGYSNKYFVVPNYTNQITYTGSGANQTTVALPYHPGLDRNAFTGPSYRDVDMTLSKGFGLPNNRVTGEDGRFEIRADAFNLFNLLNLNPGSVNSDVTSKNFGSDNSPLGGRVISITGRFSF